MTAKTNILIPDGEYHFAQFVINSLSNYKNINIHILSSKKWVESRFSSKIKSFTHFPIFSVELDTVSFLNEQIIKNDIGILLPVNFDMIRFISKHESSFDLNGHKIQVSSVKNLDIANNKWLLAKFLIQNNLPVPKTFYLKNGNFNEFSKLEYPVILKPLSNWNGNGIIKVENRDELNNTFNKICIEKEYIIQKYIDGIDYCVNVICEKGELRAYTMQKGILPNSSPFQSHLGSEFLFDKKLYDMIKRIMQKLEWSGVANFDIRYNESENQFYIIEINPRFWGSLEASTSIGVNFPHLMCLLNLGIPFEMPDYKFEKYISNKGFIKLLVSKLLLKKQIMISTDHNSLNYIQKDPLPKVFKYFKKSFKVMGLNKIKFL